MATRDYDVRVFMESVQGKELPDAICAVDREATTAERRAYRHRTDSEARHSAVTLKAVIAYLRYGVRQSALPLDVQHMAEPLRNQARRFHRI